MKGKGILPQHHFSSQIPTVFKWIHLYSSNLYRAGLKLVSSLVAGWGGAQSEQRTLPGKTLSLFLPT